MTKPVGSLFVNKRFTAPTMVCILLLAGCGRESTHQQHTAAARRPPAALPIETVRDDACACSEDACAQRVAGQLTEMRQAFEDDENAAATCLDGPSNEPAEQIQYRLGQFRDRMCSCSDRACAEATERAFMQWSLDNIDRFNGVTPTAAQQQRADALAAEFNACNEQAQSLNGGAPNEARASSHDVSIAEVRERACACRDNECRDRWDVELAAARKRFRRASRAADECLAQWLPTASVDEVLTHMGATRDKVCACRDAACIDEAEVLFIYWFAKNVHYFKPTQAQNDIAGRISYETEVCKQRISGSATTR